MEKVDCFEKYHATQSVSQESYRYTVAEFLEDHVEIEDGQDRMLYLITWTRNNH
ncbi:hypothetical protein HNQ08_002390 [Deinococcus humi]|uniref:Uncharacterized protein n=1 Tax=Deinococcus humi TaxID=662880 RepID=A0A7W8JU42_9DEIO|nr:hypothetical protein [Deinococcus humi]